MSDVWGYGHEHSTKKLYPINKMASFFAVVAVAIYGDQNDRKRTLQHYCCFENGKLCTVPEYGNWYLVNWWINIEY